MICPGFRIMSFGIYDSRITYPKAQVSPRRRVTQFELELVTESLGGTTYIGDAGHPLEKGLLIICKPGQLRYSRLPIRCHYVHLLTEDPRLRDFLQQLPDTVSLADPEPIRAVFAELVALPCDRDTGAFSAAGLVLRLLSLVQQSTDEGQGSDEGLSRSQRNILLSTERYIRMHLSQPLHLEQLARQAKFSPSHFHRIFTAFFGKTPHEFIAQCRIEEAQAALRADHCTLAELAELCGFSSQSHFTAQFKKATGQTPLQYRKQMLSRLDP